MPKQPPSIFFIGSFLSHINGTKGPSETIFEELKIRGWKLRRASRIKNKILRVIDISISLLFNFRNFEIVHIDIFSGNAFKIALLSTFISNILRKKIVITLHGGKLLDYYLGMEKSFIYLFSKANLVLTPSKFLQNGFLKEGFFTTYLPNPLDLSIFKPTNKVMGDKYIFKLLWVRSFTEIYNPDVAIKALNEVREMGINANLTMVGPDMGLLSSVKDEISKLGLSQFVNILGPINNKLLPAIYQSHDCYINTTSYESFGVSMMEAASCGLPICSNMVGEISFLWEDNVNYLGNIENDFIGMANNIFKLANDSNLRNNISKMGLKKSKEFDRSTILNLWIDRILSV